MVKFFWGQSVTGRVAASPASTFKELVDIYINIPVPLPISQKSFHKLDDDEQKEIKKSLPYLVPAVFEDSPSKRRYECALHCNLIFLDIDTNKKDGSSPAAPFVNNPDILAKNLAPFSFAAYTTVSSTDKKPRLRIMVEADEIPLDKYPHAVKTIAERIGLDVLTPESKVSVQPMFLPSLFTDQVPGFDHPYIIGDVDGLPFTVDDISVSDELFSRPRVFTEKEQMPGGEDCLAYLRPPVPEITLDVAKEAIEAIDPDLEYPLWIETAQALCHQFSPHHVDEAFELFDEWSGKGDKYPGTEEVLRKWNTITPSPVGRYPVTIRTLLHRAVENGWQSAPVKEQCFAATMKWLLDEGRTSTELMSNSLEKIAATPLLKHTEEDALLNTTVSQAKKLHKLTLSISSLRKDLKKLKEAGNTKEDSGPALEPKWLKDWCYVSSAKQFFRHRTNERIDAEAFNNTYSKMLLPTQEQLEEAGLPATEANLSKPRMRPQDYALNVHQKQVVYDYEYDPGQPNKIFTKREGRWYVNTYRKSYPEATEEGSVKAESILREHLEINFSDEAHRDHLLDWMAYQVQYPGRKIRHAPLIQGGEGCGKTFFYNCMAVVLGEDHAKLVDKNTLSGGWTEWAEGSQMVAIEEIRVVGTNKYELMNVMKPLVTNDRVPVNQRNHDTRTIRNVTNYILFSNFHDALALAQGDRRYFVLKSRLQTKEDITALGEKYFDRLFGMLEEHASGLRYFLENYEISDGFNPDGHAPRTIYLDQVIEDTSDEATALVRRMIKEGEVSLIQEDLIASGDLAAQFTLEGMKRPTDQYLSSVLRSLNFHKATRCVVDSDGKRQQIWVKDGKLKDVGDFGALVRERIRTGKLMNEIW
jgi:hypothetical protein